MRALPLSVLASTLALALAANLAASPVAAADPLPRRSQFGVVVVPREGGGLLVRSVAPYSQDPGNAERLWTLSAAAVGLG